MKRLLASLLVGLLAVGTLTGCGKTEEVKPGDNGESKVEEKQEDKVVKIFNLKVEIAEQFEALKTEFENTHPGIKVEVETAGGGVDYGAMLKTKFASGNEPDIFINGGNSEFELWSEKLEDLSDQPWVENLNAGTVDSITKDGKIYGQPVNIEGFGFLYNKDLFAQAGITEEPNSFDELQEAVNKLNEAGITPFSNGYQEWWILGMHTINAMLSQQDDPEAFINGLKEGTVNLQDNAVANKWVELLDLTVANGQKNPLTVDYNTQVTDFAASKTAMMQQGNWTQPQIDEIDPELNVGVLPMPSKDGVVDSIFVGVPSYYVMNKDSAVKEEAKEFLNWMVSSEIGQKYIVEEFKFIPAFNNIEYKSEDLGFIADAVGKYSKAGKTFGWKWTLLPDGSTQEIGAAMQEYIAGEVNKDQFLDKIEDLVVQFATK